MRVGRGRRPGRLGPRRPKPPPPPSWGGMATRRRRGGPSVTGDPRPSWSAGRPSPPPPRGHTRRVWRAGRRGWQAAGRRAARGATPPSRPPRAERSAAPRTPHAGGGGRDRCAEACSGRGRRAAAFSRGQARLRPQSRLPSGGARHPVWNASSGCSADRRRLPRTGVSGSGVAAALHKRRAVWEQTRTGLGQRLAADRSRARGTTSVCGPPAASAGRMGGCGRPATAQNKISTALSAMMFAPSELGCLDRAQKKEKE